MDNLEYQSSYIAGTESLQFIFYGGELNDQEIAAIKLQQVIYLEDKSETLTKSYILSLIQKVPEFEVIAGVKCPQSPQIRGFLPQT